MPTHARDDGFGAFRRPAQLRREIAADARLRRALHPAAERTVADRGFEPRRRRVERGVPTRQRVATERGGIDVAQAAASSRRFGPGVVDDRLRWHRIDGRRGRRDGGVRRLRRRRPCGRRTRRRGFARTRGRCLRDRRRPFDPDDLKRVVARGRVDVDRPVLTQQSREQGMHQHGGRDGRQALCSREGCFRRGFASVGEHERCGIGSASWTGVVPHAAVNPSAA
jgi:hypothetical protein